MHVELQISTHQLAKCYLSGGVGDVHDSHPAEEREAGECEDGGDKVAGNAVCNELDRCLCVCVCVCMCKCVCVWGWVLYFR